MPGQAQDPGLEDPPVEITIRGLATSQKDDAIVLTRPEKGMKITGMALRVVIFSVPKFIGEKTVYADRPREEKYGHKEVEKRYRHDRRSRSSEKYVKGPPPAHYGGGQIPDKDRKKAHRHRSSSSYHSAGRGQPDARRPRTPSP